MTGFNKDFLGEQITIALALDPSVVDQNEMVKQNAKLADGVIKGLRFAEIAPTSSQALVWNEITQLWTPGTVGGGGAGEVNTASNLGTGADGEGLFSSKFGVDLQFKRIKAGANVTLNPQTNYVEISVSSLDASAITSGTFDDARIAESNVTQHVGAIDHNSLLNYVIGQHRIINDTGSSLTELWSSAKIIDYLISTNISTDETGTSVQDKLDILDSHVTDFDNPHQVTAQLVPTNETGVYVQDELTRLSNSFLDMNEPTGFVDKDNSTISFDNDSNTFTIQPSETGGNYKVYIRNNSYTINGLNSIEISNTEGLHFIYYDITGTIQETTTFSVNLITHNALISVIYWDVTNSREIYFADERHGITMDGDTHAHLHLTLGTVIYSGLGLNSLVTDGTGDLDIHAQFGYGSGEISDEDLRFNIASSTSPANIPIYYKLGTNGDWRIKYTDDTGSELDGDDFPLIYSGTTGYTGANDRAPYNEFTGSTWQLTEVSNRDFFVMLYFVTNDVNRPIIGIQGQNIYTTLGNAREGITTELANLVTIGLPFAEFAPIAGIICQTSDGYDNDPKMRIRTLDDGSDYLDLRGVQGSSTGGISSNDHGSLTGLADDDHIQYLLLAGRSGQTITDDISIDGIFSLKETTKPSAVSTYGKIYPKSDGYLYFLNGSDIEYNLTIPDAENVNTTETGVSVQDKLDILDADAHTHSNKSELDLVTDGNHDVRTDNPHNTTADLIDTDTTGETVQDFIDNHNHDSLYINKTNTAPFTPSADYEPATKKYVDDNAGGSADFDKILTAINNSVVIDNDGSVEISIIVDNDGNVVTKT